MQRPANTLGMRHVALNVSDMAACERFYVDLLGMQVEWRPDDDNVYLTSGHDNRLMTGMTFLWLMMLPSWQNPVHTGMVPAVFTAVIRKVSWCRLSTIRPLLPEFFPDQSGCLVSP